MEWIDYSAVYGLSLLMIILAMCLFLARAWKGPTLFDRVLAVNLFGSCTMLTIALFSMLLDDPSYLDMAILYALLNFISTIAVLRFFQYGGFARDE